MQCCQRNLKLWLHCVTMAIAATQCTTGATRQRKDTLCSMAVTCVYLTLCVSLQTSGYMVFCPHRTAFSKTCIYFLRCFVICWACSENFSAFQCCMKFYIGETWACTAAQQLKIHKTCDNYKINSKRKRKLKNSTRGITIQQLEWVSMKGPLPTPPIALNV